MNIAFIVLLVFISQSIIITLRSYVSEALKLMFHNAHFKLEAKNTNLSITHT